MRLDMEGTVSTKTSVSLCSYTVETSLLDRGDYTASPNSILVLGEDEEFGERILEFAFGLQRVGCARRQEEHTTCRCLHRVGVKLDTTDLSQQG